MSLKQATGVGSMHMDKVYLRGTSIQQQQPCTAPQRRPSVLRVQNFKFMKQLGLKKPAFLPDFGLEKRKVLLDSVFTSFDNASLAPTLADEVTILKAGKSIQTKQDFITLLEQLKGAAPDWTWKHKTTAAKDDAGFTVVTLEGEGKFGGKPFAPPKTPPIEPSGKHVELDEQTARLMVEDGVIKQIEFLSQNGDFLDQLYTALGGKIPLSR